MAVTGDTWSTIGLQSPHLYLRARGSSHTGDQEDSPEPMITVFRGRGRLIYLDKQEMGASQAYEDGSHFSNGVGSTNSEPVWMCAAGSAVPLIIG